MTRRFEKLATKLIHAGEPRPRIGGAVSMPIFQSAMFEFAGETSYHDLKYIRLNNTPNHIALGEKIAALENGEAALVTASGMAAITTTLLSLLNAGDHVLAQDCLYGGAHSLMTHDLAPLGISSDLINGDDPSGWEQKLRPNTKVIYVETISNPLIQIPDLLAVVKFARAHKLISIIDNTFASPVNFRPLEHGFDIAIHSCTKYMNGHSDIVAGAIISNGELIAKIKHKLDHLGGSLDPHAAYLLQRGLKTLALRVKCQNESALKIAQFLAAQTEVARVNYPGLETHPQHQRARALFEGCGGMLSFELKGGQQAARRFMEKTTLPLLAPSLGGVETLLTIPALTSHAGLSPAERDQAGISDGLIRVSVGIEAVEEIIEDFQQALNISFS